ncbi:MAG: class I SAM-dependent methyltransferase [Deltaproteobacteria bacterium]|jgi:ubiquinone/menaquinone biosynthesis C-methylase UbiE
MTESPFHKPRGVGKSSFSLLDHDKLFETLPLQKGSTFVDLACGPGDYTLAASRIVGDEGLVYGVDIWEETIADLFKNVRAQGIKNVRGIVANVGYRLPIESGSADVCLIATVLHDLVQEQVDRNALGEAARILKSMGTLGVVEFKKEESPVGPPISIRLSPEEVESVVLSHGFSRQTFKELGLYHYLVTFALIRNDAANP